MAARARLSVRGRVQGVWYRGSMQEEARRLGVTGWAQNEPDGSVTAEIEGERPAVDAMIAWAHRGPAGARVTEVVVEWIAATGAERGRFAIRH
ncbi:MAG: acylphosphatase [Candidatus Binatia bacterium]